MEQSEWAFCHVPHDSQVTSEKSLSMVACIKLPAGRTHVYFSVRK